MTSDRDAMLAAIIDRPSDDMLRLVYADLLTELGEAERAELIRVQLRLATDTSRCTARYEADCDSCRLAEALYLENLKLLDKYSWQWFGDTACTSDRFDFTMQQNKSILVQRGFVSQVKGDVASMLGGECPRCGHTIYEDLSAKCQICGDFGEVRGFLPRLAAENPIELVWASDDEIVPIPTRHGTVFYGIGYDSMRPDVFELLQPELTITLPSPYREELHCVWTTLDAAKRGFSDAVLSLARSIYAANAAKEAK